MKRLVAFCTGILSYLTLSAQVPVLTVEGGEVSGVPSETPDVCIYKGIPYAAPPVGDLRWKHPQPVQPWKGVRPCDTFGAASLQGDQTPGSFYWKEFHQDGDPKRSEDCLYLNVWTPAAGKPEAKLPVIFWIHGGAYMGGYGHEIEFGGDAYAKKGVILGRLCEERGHLGHHQLPVGHVRLPGPSTTDRRE